MDNLVQDNQYFENLSIELRSVRKIQQDNRIYWFGVDLLKFFDLDNEKTLLDRLEPYDYDRVYINTDDKEKTLLITEYGVYDLYMQISIPETSDFRKWLKEEVLPSIRKHHSFSIGQSLQMRFQDLHVIIEAEDTDGVRCCNLLRNLDVIISKFIKQYKDLLNYIDKNKEYYSDYKVLEAKIDLTTESVNALLGEDLDRLLSFYHDRLFNYNKGKEEK